jgi:hypothetical protein
MSFFKRILGELKETTIQMIDDQYKSEREQLLRDLCETLQQFGVKGIPLEPGSPEEGRKVFAKKQCNLCHSKSAKTANLSGSKGQISPIFMAQTMWNHLGRVVLPTCTAIGLFYPVRYRYSLDLLRRDIFAPLMPVVSKSSFS